MDILFAKINVKLIMNNNCKFKLILNILKYRDCEYFENCR